MKKSVIFLIVFVIHVTHSQEVNLIAVSNAEVSVNGYELGENFLLACREVESCNSNNQVIEYDDLAFKPLAGDSESVDLAIYSYGGIGIDTFEITTDRDYGKTILGDETERVIRQLSEFSDSELNNVNTLPVDFKLAKDEIFIVSEWRWKFNNAALLIVRSRSVNRYRFKLVIGNTFFAIDRDKVKLTGLQQGTLSKQGFEEVIQEVHEYQLAENFMHYVFGELGIILKDCNSDSGEPFSNCAMYDGDFRSLRLGWDIYSDIYQNADMVNHVTAWRFIEDNANDPFYIRGLEIDEKLIRIAFFTNDGAIFFESVTR